MLPVSAVCWERRPNLRVCDSLDVTHGLCPERHDRSGEAMRSVKSGEGWLLWVVT